MKNSVRNLFESSLAIIKIGIYNSSKYHFCFFLFSFFFSRVNLFHHKITYIVKIDFDKKRATGILQESKLIACMA